MPASGESFSRKKLIAFFLIVAFVMFAVAAQDVLPVSGIPHLFYGQFDNGLDFYFLEDYSAPTSSFCYAVKAGTSVQTAETTGFSELYARLFFSPAGGQQAFCDNGAFSVNAECTSDYALYSATFSADRITDILSLLAECAGAESFPEEELWTQYQAMRRKASEWDASSESYINGAMDAKMFPAYPWSRETGLNAEAFNGYSLEAATMKLDEMRRTYYEPENAALFMCGPFAPDEVFELLVSLAPVADGSSLDEDFAAFSNNVQAVSSAPVAESAQADGVSASARPADSAPVTERELVEDSARIAENAPSFFDTAKTVPLSDFWEPGVYSFQELLAFEEAAPVTQELRHMRLSSCQGNVPNLKRSGGGRYVLVSDSFSKDFNQIIVQYVLPDCFMTAAGAAETTRTAGTSGVTGSAGVAAAETAASVFENGSAFKNLVLADETCGIKSADWLYTSFSRQQSGSRLIFQALMENGEVSPGTQALAFSRCIENPDVFQDDEVAYFSRITADRLSLLRRDPFTLIHTLAEDWAFCNPVFPEMNRALSEQGFPSFSYNNSFAEQFSASYADAARSLSASELFHVLDSEPYIFLLLNNNVYNENIDLLEKDGFTLISQENGAWYKTGDYKKNKTGDYETGDNSSATAENEQSFAGLVMGKLATLLVPDLDPELEPSLTSAPSSFTADFPEAEQNFSLAQESDSAQSIEDTGVSNGIANYIAHGKSATKQERLSNGIPVLIHNGTTSAFSFQIQFSSKKEGFSASERDMRTVVSDVISNNIRQYILYSGAVPYSDFSISSECTLYGSSIVISTTSEYAEPVISLAAEALFFGEISAPRVDESAYNLGSEWSMKRTDGDFQLHSAALSRLYQGLNGSGYFDLKNDFLADIAFQDIEIEYLSMLDAAGISLAICGENAADYVSLAENCFGFLVGFSTTCRDSAVTSPETAFPDESVPVTFRRIFTSSVKPGEYVLQPQKLIPTEVFYDPFHIYFECPSYDSPEYAVFAALVYELEEILDGMWEPGVLASFDMLYAPVAGVWFHGVTRAADVYDVLVKGLEKLQEPFDDSRIQKIKSRYIEKLYTAQDSAASSTANMLLSRFYGGDGTTYLSQLEQLKNAAPEDFATAAARFATMTTLRAISADTK